MYVYVHPTRFAESWGRRGDPAATPAAPQGPLAALRDALEAEYSTFAHATTYYVVDGDQREPRAWRINKDALSIPGVEAAIRCQVLWVDLDRRPHEPWADPSEAVGVVATLAGMFPHAAVYSTRRGARMAVVLDRPYSVREYASATASALAQVAQAVADAGLPVTVDDTTGEWGRLFQLPKVVRDGEATWTQPWFALHVPQVLAPLQGGPGNPADCRFAPAAPIAWSPPTDAPADVSVPAQVWDALIDKLAEPLAARGQNGLLGKLRAGEPFFEPGERNAKTFRSVYAVADLLSEANEAFEAADLYRLFHGATIATRGATPPAEALRELWGICVRIVDGVAFRGVAEHEPLPWKVTPGADGSPVPILAYTGKSRYIYDPARGGYSPPLQSSATLSAVFLSIWGRVFPGTTLKTPESKLLLDHGTHVDEVLLALDAEVPRVEGGESRGKSLILPAGRRTVVAPEYDADVAEWLRLMGGTDHDGLLSWLHWAPNLRAKLCALYLQGPPDCGKSMIAQALSQFWGGTFVSFDEAVDKYNGRLATSPLIWLDERATVSNTAAFRSLVGNDAHKIERKYLDSETLLGNLRLLVSANNPDALPLDDVRTLQDVLAVIQRVRFIEVDGSAADYLRDRGGMSSGGLTEFWVREADGSPGRLVRHIAWLAANPPVLPEGRRFRVEGVASSWHVRSLYAGPVGVVLATVASALAAGTGAGNVVVWDGERLGVDVVGFFETPLAKRALSEDRVSPQAARDVLASLALRETFEWAATPGAPTRRYLAIPPSLLRDMPATTFRRRGDAEAIHKIWPET